MAFTEKGTSQEVETIHDVRKIKDPLVGIYRGHKQFDSKRPGEVVTLHLMEIAGKTEGFWGAKDLNEKLVGEEGKKVSVSFAEKKQLKDGRTKNIFKVLVDNSK